MSSRAQPTLASVWPLLLLAFACGDSSSEGGASAAGGSLSAAEHEAIDKAHGEAQRLFAGEVRLLGGLASAREGVLWLYARQTGTRSPVLIRRYRMDDAAFRQEGEERVLAFELRSVDSMMPGMPVALPEQVELKIEYDPDGLVETKEGTEAVVLPVAAGTFDIAVSLRPGMEKPVEVPSNYPSVVGEQPASPHGSPPAAPPSSPHGKQR